MELMRHTDPRLTMKVYTTLRLKDTAGAVETLPISALVEIEQAKATGTDDAIGSQNPAEERVANRVATLPIVGHSSAVNGKEKSRGAQRKTPGSAGVRLTSAGIGTDSASSLESSAGRTRTYNQPVNSRLLYH